MLFSINKKALLVLHPDCIKLCPEFAYLDQKEMLVVILAYDYKSPYRQFTEDQRKPKAQTQVYGPGGDNIFDKPKIKKAAELYRSLQFDPRREQIITYQKRLGNLNILLDTIEDDDLKRLKDVIAASKDLRKAIAEIELELTQEEESGLTETEDKVKLSWLEKMITNRERYLAVTKKKDGLRST